MRPLPFLLLFFFSLPAAHAESLFVSGDQGVREVGLDGRTIRLISREKARRPRLMPDGKSLLYLVPGRAEVKRMDLATGVSAKVAVLPKSFRICKQPEQDSARSYKFADLDVQSAGDFTIDKSGAAACLTLMDRNINMADVSIELRVPIQGAGKVLWAVSVPSNCPGPKIAACEQAVPTFSEPPAGAYELQDGWLVSAKKQLVRLGKGDFSKEASSPKGKWAVIGGNIEEGDYIHRSLYLLGRRDGTIHSIDAKSVILTRKYLRAMDVDSMPAVGETEIRWLNDDALLIDSTLIFPGKGLVELGGEVAR